MRVFTDGKYRAATSLVGTAFGELEFSAANDANTLRGIQIGIEIKPGIGPMPSVEELQQFDAAIQSAEDDREQEL